MPDIWPYKALEPFLAKLKEQGIEYTASEPQESYRTIDVIYEAKGYGRCRMFHKPVKNEEIKRLLLQGQFPTNGIDLVLRPENEQPLPTLEYMREFIGQFPVNLILAGPEQIGKTYSTIWLTKELLIDRTITRPWFVRAGGIRKERKKRGWHFVFPLNTDLLIIDDLGTESVIAEISNENQDKKALIFEVIDYRIGEKLPTVITTNLSMEGMNHRYSYKTIARLENNGIIKFFDPLPDEEAYDHHKES